MGSYTRFNCKIRLRHDTPPEVINILKMCTSKDENETFDICPVALFNTSDFFKCRWWVSLFSSKNLDDSLGGSKFYQKSNNRWVLEIDTDFKDYDDEINKFLDWIKQYVAGRKVKTYIGWSKHESWEASRLYHRVDCSVRDNRKIF